MDKKYNIIGKVDKPNTKLINKIIRLRKKGVYWRIIASEVERSQKRIKELYFNELEKRKKKESLDKE